MERKTRTPRQGPKPATVTAVRVKDQDVDVLATQLATATAALTTPPAPARALPLPPAPCFVCQAPTISKRHNGRCRACWEVFRATGTDRAPEDVAPPALAPDAQGRPAHTCACGTVFYGTSVSTQCYKCWKAAKATRQAQTMEAVA